MHTQPGVVDLREVLQLREDWVKIYNSKKHGDSRGGKKKAADVSICPEWGDDRGECEDKGETADLLQHPSTTVTTNVGRKS